MKKRQYTQDETVANLSKKTGAEKCVARQEFLLAIEKTTRMYPNLIGAERDGCIWRIAYNALTDDARKTVRQRKREVSIFNENPNLDGQTYAESLQEIGLERLAEKRERHDRMEELLRQSGERTLELAQLCFDIADLLDPDSTVNDIQRALKEAWQRLYPHANDRDYYWTCDKIKRTLRTL